MCLSLSWARNRRVKSAAPIMRTTPPPTPKAQVVVDSEVVHSRAGPPRVPPSCLHTLLSSLSLSLSLSPYAHSSSRACGPPTRLCIGELRYKRAPHSLSLSRKRTQHTSRGDATESEKERERDKEPDAAERGYGRLFYARASDDDDASSYNGLIVDLTDFI